MKKVYVIGSTESNTNALEEIKKTIGHVGHGVEIICVNNIEEVPFQRKTKIRHACYPTNL